MYNYTDKSGKPYNFMVMSPNGYMVNDPAEGIIGVGEGKYLLVLALAYNKNDEAVVVDAIQSTILKLQNDAHAAVDNTERQVILNSIRDMREAYKKLNAGWKIWLNPNMAQKVGNSMRNVMGVTTNAAKNAYTCAKTKINQFSVGMQPGFDGDLLVAKPTERVEQMFNNAESVVIGMSQSAQPAPQPAAPTPQERAQAAATVVTSKEVMDALRGAM